MSVYHSFYPSFPSVPTLSPAPKHQHHKVLKAPSIPQYPWLLVHIHVVQYQPWPFVPMPFYLSDQVQALYRRIQQHVGSLGWRDGRLRCLNRQRLGWRQVLLGLHGWDLWRGRLWLVRECSGGELGCSRLVCRHCSLAFVRLTAVIIYWKI